MWFEWWTFEVWLDKSDIFLNCLWGNQVLASRKYMHTFWFNINFFSIFRVLYVLMCWVNFLSFFPFPYIACLFVPYPPYSYTGRHSDFIVWKKKSPWKVEFCTAFGIGSLFSMREDEENRNCLENWAQNGQKNFNWWRISGNFIHRRLKIKWKLPCKEESSTMFAAKLSTFIRKKDWNISGEKNS